MQLRLMIGTEAVGRSSTKMKELLQCTGNRSMRARRFPTMCSALELDSSPMHLEEEKIIKHSRTIITFMCMILRK